MEAVNSYRTGVLFDAIDMKPVLTVLELADARKVPAHRRFTAITDPRFLQY
jgi:hypothetical protein